jgi:hypothetical protein
MRKKREEKFNPFTHSGGMKLLNRAAKILVVSSFNNLDKNTKFPLSSH